MKQPAPKHIILIENPTRPFAQKTSQVIKSLAKATGVRTTVRLTKGDPVGQDPDIFDDQGDLIIACGGDGTIIEAAHRSRGSGIPIAGINAGYLGFLSAFSGKNHKALVAGTKKILAGNYLVERRATIEALGMWAVNDIVITREDKGCLIDLHLKIGKTAATKYYGDGLIIATPTGSTAYNLAAGGPVLTQGNRSLVLTPICPHSFANRSVIVSENEAIEILCPKNNRTQALLACDGKLRPLNCGTNIKIEVSQHDFPLVSINNTNRYEILVEKLGWKPLPKHEK